jgi:hypothetical protein
VRALEFRVGWVDLAWYVTSEEEGGEQIGSSFIDEAEASVRSHKSLTWWSGLNGSYVVTRIERIGNKLRVGAPQ